MPKKGRLVSWVLFSLGVKLASLQRREKTKAKGKKKKKKNVLPTKASGSVEGHRP